MHSAEELNAYGEVFNTYGFLLIFGIIAIVIIATAAVLIFKIWSKRENKKLNSESEQERVELDLAKQEREANIQRERQIMDFVTQIQTEQVSQMKAISVFIDNLKNEFASNTYAQRETAKVVNDLSDDLTHMSDKLDKFYGKLEEVSVILNQCYAVDKHILEVVSERKETLDMQIQDKEEK